MKKITLEDFIRRSRETHGDFYDYSKTDWNGTVSKKVEIICPDHGSFWQYPSGHMGRGIGCPQCKRSKLRKAFGFSKDEFIKRSVEVHNNKYDYSKVKYINLKTKVEIICPDHGSFWQTPANHIHNKSRCPRCSGKYKCDNDWFIENAREVHGDRYDYSKINYTGSFNKVEIICPDHGSFWQTPNDHINGEVGCFKCGVDSKRMTTEEFIGRANDVHKKRYDYSKLSYANNSTKVEIICPDHGSFWQTPANHIHNFHGCPRCNDSTPERMIADYIKSISNTEIVRNSRKIIAPLELDIFLPEFNLAIEYNGLRWHSEEMLRTPKTYHYEKYKRCEVQGIQLLSIFSNEWKEKPEVVKSIIANKIGKTSNKIFARKCEIINLPLSEAKDFTNKNHIQSFKGSAKYCYGLKYKDTLVACMIIGQHPRNSTISLNRYSTLLHTNIIGGFTRLLKHAHKQIRKNITTWSDNRWSNGRLYKENGFELISQQGPSYEYANTAKEKIIPKQNMQKTKIGCPKNVLEHVFVREKYGYYRVWDCGKKTWMYRG